MSSNSSFGNPTRLFKRAFGIVYIGAAIIQFIISVFFAVARFLANFVANLHWLFIIGGLWFASMLFFSYGFPIIEEVEFLWRCEVEPWYPEFFRPFFEALVEIWTEVCWWNLIGETQRMLSGKLIWDTLMHCKNGFRFWDFIIDVMKSFIYLFSTYFKWFFVGNVVDDQLPIYPWYKSIAVLGVDLGNMIVCLCADLRILVELFTRIVISNNLSCFLHQITNALLDVLQTIVRFLIDVIKLFFDMVIAHPGDLNYLVSKLSGEIPGFTIPSVVTATERTAVAAYYAGQFLNDALQIIVCTGISEVEVEGDVSLVETKYAACMADNTTRTDLFCWTGPVVGIFYRLERAIFSAVINLPRILFELVTLPPGPRFLTDVWIVDEVYDTVRFPPPRYNYSSSLKAPVLLVGSNLSRIVPLQPDLYGNYTDPFNVSCVDYNVSRFIVPCQNCSEVEQYDLEECICFLSRDVDRLIFDILDFKILDGVLCCVAGKILRIMTAVVKFVQGLISHIIVFDRFSEFITDQNNWNAPIDEIVGPYYQIGGLLSCCARILDGFNPKLECLCTLIVNLMKPLVEIFRILLESVVAFLNDVFNTGNIGFFDVVCTTKPTCFDLEVRVFQYLRRTRPNIVNGTDPNYLDTYFPVNATQPPAWIDCFCDLVSFEFLNQFLDDPVSPLPDFCCAINTAFRFLMEAIKFAIGLLFTVFETVASIFRPGPVQLTFLGYLACDTVESCAPIAQMLSDVKDFLGCECLLVKAIDDNIDPTKEDLLCLCDFFNAVANLVYDVLHGLALVAQTVVQLLNCIYLGFPVGQDCGMVPPGCVGSACDSRLLKRVEQLFLDFNNALLDLADIVGTIGCVLGLLFRFDCMGTRYFSPPDYPVCSHGSAYGTCAMGDRLQRFFRDTFLVLITIPKFLLDTLKSFALVAFHFAFTGFTGLADLVYKFLIALGDPFFGTAAHTDPDTGLPVAATAGWLQSLCLTLNCLLGPLTDECTNEAGPALDANANGACIGDFLCVLGNVLRDLWQEIASLISSIVGIFEALFSGNGDLLAQRIVQFFKALINILVTILGGLEQLIQTIINVLVGIANSILPGFGTLLGFALNIATGVAQVLLIIIGNLLAGFVGKRSVEAFGDLSSLSEEERNVLETEFYEASFPASAFAHPMNAVQDNYDKIVYFYAKHFKFMLFDKTPQTDPFEANPENQKRFQYYDENGRLSDLREKKKRDGTPVTFNDLRNMDFTTKTQTMLEKMTQGTYCKTAMKQFSSLQEFDSMSLSEELIWKACFVAYALPIGVNAFYDSQIPSVQNQRRSEQQQQQSIPNPGIQLPEDVFYNPITFLNTGMDMMNVVKEYASWRLHYKSIMEEFPQDYVDIQNIPDWFWAYEQQVYAASLNNNITQGNGNKRSYVYEPKRSPSPNRYVYHPDEIWERINDHLLFINLPGDQLSVPVIDGRYPMYERNVTFSEHLKQKGLTSAAAQNLAQSLIFQDKINLEDNMLKMYSVFDNMEKNFREHQTESTDEFGNYYPNRTNHAYKYPWIPQHYPGSSIGLMWDKLFQMNAKKTPQTSSSSSSSSEKKRFDHFDLSDYVQTLSDSVFYVKTYWNKLLGRKAPVDYKKETETLFSKRTNEQRERDQQTRKARSKIVLESYEKAFDESVPKLKKSIEEKAFGRLGSFDFKKYFTEVVPATVVLTWGRLSGQISTDDVAFELYVKREYGDSLNLDDFKTKSMLDPKKRFVFSTKGNESVHPFSLTMEDLKKEYEGKYYKGDDRKADPRTRYVMQRQPIDIRGSANCKKRSTMSLRNEEPIKEKYGHILGKDSLVGHRLKMMQNATKAVYKKALATSFSLDRIVGNIKTKYLNRYLKIYSDTIRVKKRSPTFFALFSLFDRLASAFNGGAYSEGHLFHEDSALKRFMTYGDAAYDDDFKSLGDGREDDKNRTALVKRQSEIPIVPICLPGNAELTCISCKKCPVAECSNCSSCRNCTTFVGGAVECERCAVCSIGGPNCGSGCTGCETCATEGVCLDCLIIEEFISSVIYFTKFCIALDNNDTSVIRQPLPNTTLINIVHRNASNPTFYSDPIENWLFNTIVPTFTDIDIGATIVDFVTNTNLDPFEGSVGLLFFLRRWLHLPFIRQCNWDIDLQCTFGYGLEEGIVFATIVCVVLGILAWFVFPPLAAILSNFIVTAGWLVFWATLVMSRAWFYNPYCLMSPTSILYSFLFPHFPILPVFPRCAAEQILAFLDKWVKPCYDFFQIAFFSKLTNNGETCLTCPLKQHLFNCSSFGFTSQFTTVGYYIQRDWPNGAAYLNQTCLVKGGCFLGLGGEWGPIEDFFDSKFNITFFPNGTPTNFTQTLDTCAASYFWTALASLALLLLLAYLLFPLVVDVLTALWIFLQSILVIPPFSFLVVWPFTYLINPYNSGGWAPDGSYHYWNGDTGGGGRGEKRNKKSKSKKKRKKQKSNKKKEKTKKKIKSSINTNIYDEDSEVENTNKVTATTVRYRKRKFIEPNYEPDDSSSSSSSFSDSDFSFEECEYDDIDDLVSRETITAERYMGFSGSVKRILDVASRFYKEKRRNEQMRMWKKFE